MEESAGDDFEREDPERITVDFLVWEQRGKHFRSQVGDLTCDFVFLDSVFLQKRLEEIELKQGFLVQEDAVLGQRSHKEFVLVEEEESLRDLPEDDLEKSFVSESVREELLHGLRQGTSRFLQDYNQILVLDYRLFVVHQPRVAELLYYTDFVH